LSPWHALVLGIVQGVSEFLPISSSGHLIVVPWLLGWTVQSLSFDVALHVGTLGAVVYAFRGDWQTIAVKTWRGLLQGRPFAEPEGRLLGLLAIGSVPAAVAGVFLEHWADTVFRSPALVATTMALMGAILFLADRRAEHAASSRITVRDALLVGIAQALALVPGVSRSGATISMALFLGFRREQAARFSFLLATPITFGAAVLKLRHFVVGADAASVAVGTAAAAVSGFLSIRLLLHYVRTRDYRPFVLYRFAFAALIVAMLLVRGS
jgi:undecaprenyl-diphosphatase